MANSSATRIGGLSSAMLLPMTTNAAFEILRASPAAIRLGEGDRFLQPTGAILARKDYAAQPKYCDKPLSMSLTYGILLTYPRPRLGWDNHRAPMAIKLRCRSFGQVL
jgi:hypothetical protein